MATPTAWVGADGNLYFGSGAEGAPVQNLGNYAQNYDYKEGNIVTTNFDTPLGQGPGGILGVKMIDDPNPPSSAPSGGGGGTVAPTLDEAGIRNTQKTIDEIPGLLAAALEAEKARASNANRTFDAQEAQQRDTYDKSTITNQQNYDANFMDSIRAGIKGLGGLFQILRGTGAAGGTAEDSVRDTVGAVTSQDIRAGADTRNENQTALDSSLANFLTTLRGKRETNEDTRVNNERAIRRDSDSQLQELYGKMAGFYRDAERTADADSWMDRAGNLTPKIAENSRTQVSKYDTSPIEVRAPEITAFSGPSQPNIVTRPDSGQIGSGIFTITDRERRREQQPAFAGA